jgi:hypothetical protein
VKNGVRQGDNRITGYKEKFFTQKIGFSPPASSIFPAHLNPKSKKYIFARYLGYAPFTHNLCLSCHSTEESLPLFKRILS